MILEHHPNDSRLKIKEDGICQTLSSRMGTGGGNVPLVMVIDDGTEDNSDGSGWLVHGMEHGRNRGNIKKPDGWPSTSDSFGRG